MSKILAVVGNSQAGKTRLIERLIPELIRRGLTVAVVKHCPHGFQLDMEGKDTHRFFRAGAEAVAMAGPDQTALVKRSSATADLYAFARTAFPEADVVLVEGGKGIKGFRKIEILRRGVSEKPSSPSSELVAMVADFAAESEKPVLDPENVPGVADIVEKAVQDEDDEVVLEVEGSPVPIRTFAQEFIKNVVLGMIRSLHGVKDHPRNISIAISGTGKKKGNP